MSIGKKLTALMYDKGVTQREVAKAIGLSKTSVSYAVNGRVVPKADTLIKLAAYFGVTVDELLKGES